MAAMTVHGRRGPSLSRLMPVGVRQDHHGTTPAVSCCRPDGEETASGAAGPRHRLGSAGDAAAKVCAATFSPRTSIDRHQGRKEISHHCVAPEVTAITARVSSDPPSQRRRRSTDHWNILGGTAVKLARTSRRSGRWRHSSCRDCWTASREVRARYLAQGFSLRLGFAGGWTALHMRRLRS